MPEDKIMRPATTSEERKASPVHSGFDQYFPAARELVARLSKLANDKHNPGRAMHWSRDKSTDHADCIARHQGDVGTLDPEFDLDHAVSVAWRAMAQLQILAETKYGWPVAPGAKPAEPKPTARQPRVGMVIRHKRFPDNTFTIEKIDNGIVVFKEWGWDHLPTLFDNYYVVKE